MSTSVESVPPLCVVGTTGSRRVRGFVDAAVRAGLPQPTIRDWRAVLDGDPAIPQGCLVRIDTPGENPVVSARLAGTPEAERDLTRPGTSRRWYDGLLAAIAQVHAAAAAAGAGVLTGADAVADCFDKQRCHSRLQAAGIPVPRRLPGWSSPRGAADGVDALLENMRRERMPAVFAKPVHGSSGAGVLAVQAHPRDAQRLVVRAAMVRDAAGVWRNSTRIGAFRDREARELIAAMLPFGLHVEQWVPKIQQDGRFADLRVVVVAGKATHAVVRTSPGVITNLNLGHGRGDLDVLRRELGSRWDEVLVAAEQAAALWPDTLMLGIDVLVPARGGRPLVLEVNVFGDLLPNLPALHPPHGSTYDVQIAAIQKARCLA